MTRSDAYPFIALAAAIYAKALEDKDTRWLQSETAELYYNSVLDYCYGSDQLLPISQRMHVQGAQYEHFDINK